MGETWRQAPKKAQGREHGTLTHFRLLLCHSPRSHVTTPRHHVTTPHHPRLVITPRHSSSTRRRLTSPCIREGGGVGQQTGQSLGKEGKGPEQGCRTRAACLLAAHSAFHCRTQCQVPRVAHRPFRAL